MNLTCPNRNSPEWKTLENRVGKLMAYKYYLENNGKIATPKEVMDQIQKDMFPNLNLKPNSGTISTVRDAIQSELPSEVANSVQIVEAVPLEILGRTDLFLSLKDILNDNGINDKFLINWAGLNKDKIGNIKTIKSESDLLNKIQSIYNKKKESSNHPELKKNKLASESFDKWVLALSKYPLPFQEVMLTHAIKYLNPERRSKYVLQLSEIALTNTYGMLMNKPHEINRLGKLYDQEVLAILSDAVNHEPSASGKGYWVHIPRVQDVNSKDHATNVELLKKLSPSTWCTAGATAESYVYNYDNYILIVNGVTITGIEAKREKNAEGKIQVNEVTSRNNNQIASIDYLDDTIAFFNKHNLDLDNKTIRNALIFREQGKTDNDYDDHDDYDDYDYERYRQDMEWNEVLDTEESETERSERIVMDLNTVEETLANIDVLQRVGKYFLKPELYNNEAIDRAYFRVRGGYALEEINPQAPYFGELVKEMLINSITDNGFNFYQSLNQSGKISNELEESLEKDPYIKGIIENNKREVDERNRRLAEAQERWNQRQGQVGEDDGDLPFSKTNSNLIQGYYDAKNDKVVVVASNTPANEASKVAIHEVAHRGMLRMAKELGGVKELGSVLYAAEEQLMKKLPELLERTGHKSLESLMLDYGFTKDGEESKIKLLMELSARWAETLVNKPKPIWWKQLMKGLTNWISKFAGVNLNEQEVNKLVGGFVQYGTQEESKEEEETNICEHLPF